MADTGSRGERSPASEVKAEEEGLELEEPSDLVFAEGCDVEVAKHLRHAADVYDAGELGVGDPGIHAAPALLVAEACYHLRVIGLVGDS